MKTSEMFINSAINSFFHQWSEIDSDLSDGIFFPNSRLVQSTPWAKIWEKSDIWHFHSNLKFFRKKQPWWKQRRAKKKCSQMLIIHSPLPFSNMYSVHVLLLHFFPISTPAVSQLKFRIVNSLSLLWWFFEASLLKAHTDLISPWLCTIRPINCFSYVLMISLEH